MAEVPLDVLRTALTGPGAPSHLPVHMVLYLRCTACGVEAEGRLDADG